ncbi:hypothetical protein [Terrabacter sp. C0L_2]|uniref:hypothetical protein n=1 Tax=Terrabacter sp. C0L_2 TaxID=3108389 RepID=UPI002ED2D6D9|nr:hypothetical protein U5C87_10975 [Terrabacter sp. C0L_2]
MSAAFRPGPDAGVTVDGDNGTVYVARLPGGPLLVLEGAAAVIWAEATAAPAAGWLSRVAAAVGHAEDVIAADVEDFVADLRARQLLVPVDGDDQVDGADAPQ